VPDFTITSAEHAGVTRLTLRGEFDLAGIDQFNRAVHAVETREPVALVIDMSALAFMDSSGLRALITAHERAQKGGWRLAIVPGPPAVRRVFEVTQMDERLDLIEDAAAVSA
jgi:anti-anti-sigma factor